jgi:beta-glucosidase
MGAFNEVSGVPMHANDFLINGVLRREWGWNGVLVSDYTGVMELMPHGIARDRTQAGILAITAGVDIDMVSGIYIEQLPAAVRAGQMAEAAVDEAVRRVLRAKYRLGLFEDPFRYSNLDREARLTLAAEHIAEARALARKSIVLLKNAPRAGAPVLPLRKDLRTLAVFGTLAQDRGSALGPGPCQGAKRMPSRCSTASARQCRARRYSSPPAHRSKTSTVRTSQKRCALRAGRTR